jgi:hypothetical protein
MSGANSSELFALSSLIGKECHAENVSFMRCKQGDGNPAACLDKGEAVCACVLGVMKRAAKTAKAEVDELKQCLDTTNNDFVACGEIRTAMTDAFYGLNQ